MFPVGCKKQGKKSIGFYPIVIDIMMKFQGDEASIIILRALKDKVKGMASDIDRKAE